MTIMYNSVRRQTDSEGLQTSEPMPRTILNNESQYNSINYEDLLGVERSAEGPRVRQPNPYDRQKDHIHTYDGVLKRDYEQLNVRKSSNYSEPRFQLLVAQKSQQMITSMVLGDIGISQPHKFNNKVSLPKSSNINKDQYLQNHSSLQQLMEEPKQIATEQKRSSQDRAQTSNQSDNRLCKDTLVTTTLLVEAYQKTNQMLKKEQLTLQDAIKLLRQQVELLEREAQINHQDPKYQKREPILSSIEREMIPNSTANQQTAFMRQAAQAELLKSLIRQKDLQIELLRSRNKASLSQLDGYSSLYERQSGSQQFKYVRKDKPKSRHRTSPSWDDDGTQLVKTPSDYSKKPINSPNRHKIFLQVPLVFETIRTQGLQEGSQKRLRPKNIPVKKGAYCQTISRNINSGNQSSRWHNINSVEKEEKTKLPGYKNSHQVGKIIGKKRKQGAFILPYDGK